MLLYILSGCSDEPMTQHFGETTTEKFQTSGDGFLSLPSKDALQDAIEQGTMTRSLFPVLLRMENLRLYLMK